MPYKLDKPPDKIKDLPKDAQEVWIKAYNAAYKQYDKDEEKSNKVAWSAVTKAGYEKNKQGKWVKVKKEGISVSKLQKFMESLIADAKSVWKSKEAEQEKRDILSQAVGKSALFSRDSYVHAVFPDVIIVRDYEQLKYFALEYKITKKTEVEFGESQEVEIAYIPTTEQKNPIPVFAF